MPHLRVRRGLAVIAAATLPLLAGACFSDKTAKPKPEAGSSAPVTSAPPETPAPAPNGVDRKPAKEILSKARKAFAAAKSVHLTGHISAGSQSVSVDMRLGRDVAQGTLKGPVRGAMVPIEIIKVKGKTYFRGKELWRKAQGPEAAKLFGNRWVKAPPSKTGLGEVSVFTDLKAFQRVFQTSSITKGKTATVDGQSAITLKDGKGGLMYIATTGKPYLLKLGEAAKKPKNELSFREYDGVVEVNPPADPIDIGKLKKKG